MPFAICIAGRISVLKSVLQRDGDAGGYYRLLYKSFRFECLENISAFLRQENS